MSLGDWADAATIIASLLALVGVAIAIRSARTGAEQFRLQLQHDREQFTHALEHERQLAQENRDLDALAASREAIAVHAAAEDPLRSASTAMRQVFDQLADALARQIRSRQAQGS